MIPNKRKKKRHILSALSGPQNISLPALMRQTKEFAKEKVAKNFRQQPPPPSSSNGREISQRNALPLSSPGNLAGGWLVKHHPPPLKPPLKEFFFEQ
ncbi:hypothetical protein CDAR_242091 [Caerostris darwini]|uniref:Uncharacterized protein n=1 Tax=Caerostris darwini TaxID=1538125 RepID=A0AAV4NMA2_9ARAC|nr:hypothetical protein CDAR_242091 [Caerostris darwini]